MRKLFSTDQKGTFVSVAGRKKYVPTKQDIKRVEDLVAQGYTQESIARHLGISVTTFWRNSAKFENAIKKGRDRCKTYKLERVKDALFRRAVGYGYTERHVEREAGQVKKVKIVRKRQTPSDSAIFFYLVNRDPANWKSINQPKPENPSEHQTIRFKFEKIEPGGD